MSWLSVNTLVYVIHFPREITARVRGLQRVINDVDKITVRQKKVIKANQSNSRIQSQEIIIITTPKLLFHKLVVVVKVTGH